MALDIYAGLKNTYKSFLHSLRISTSNANNFNTPGFKTSQVRFSTYFSRVIHSGSETTNPQVFDTSVTVGSTITDFQQGSLGVGTALDVAIVGEGFFVTSKSASSANASAAAGASIEKAFTRAGRFQFDASNKFLIDSFGRKVMGFKVNQNGDKIGGLVPIESDGETDLGFIDGGVLVTNFQAHKNSVAAGNATHPEQKKIFRVALQSFQNNQGLVQTVGTSYRATIAAGQEFEADISGASVYGNILAENLEGSNVDVSQVALEMTLINRGLSAVNGILEDVNKILSNAISKIAG